MLLHPALAVAFSLDPLFPQYAARYYKGGHKVLEVPDPLPVEANRLLRAETEGSPAESSSHRTSFLLFGALTQRKGIFEVLRALETLDATTGSRISVIFAGELDQTVRLRFLRRVRELLQHRPDLSVEVVDRHIEDAELAERLSRCDWILLPYQRFVGSSGVLVWATAARKPVVAQDYGLVGALVRRYGLGIVVDSTKPVALGVALREAVTTVKAPRGDSWKHGEFLRGRTPERFASAILGRIADLVRPARSM